jgi:hypothetical protein
MPIKFKQSSRKKNGRMQHSYMHTTPVSELQDALENRNTPAKLKGKIRNYLQSKKIEVAK